MKARFYDPDLGQFLNQDAFEGVVDTPPSLHKYLYAFANPLVFFDPSGNVTEAIDPAVDLEGARAQIREKTRLEKAALAKLENSACGTANAPSQCIAPNLSLRKELENKSRTTATESQSKPGTDSAITDTCGDDEACRINKAFARDRQKNVDAMERIARATGEQIKEDLKDEAPFLLLGPLVGKVLNTIPGVKSQVKKFFKKNKKSEDIKKQAVSDDVTKGTAGSVRNVNPTKGTQNCVNCSIATDATLAGRPASALRGSRTSVSVLEKQFGGTFRVVSGRSEIESIVSSAGSGTRGIVFGARGDRTGHVFNVVNQKGTVRFLDGQTGKPASFDGFTSFQFLRTN